MTHRLTARIAAIAIAACAAVPAAHAQVGSPEPSREEINAGSTTERDRELKLLGISAMTPAVTARPMSAPNITNYDEARANPYPKLPELLVTNAGAKVTTSDQWWKVRRPEILELFDREVYGRVPANVPPVRWHLVEEVEDNIGGVAVTTKRLVGHVDNSGAPGMNVDMMMNVTVPVAAKGRRIPAIMAFGSTAPRAWRAAGPYITQQAPLVADGQTQVLRKGWAYVVIDTNSIQADNGWGLDKGIIGLVNKGQPRKLDDWGVLRAWAWGASRGVDYLETNADIDPRQIAIMGMSRTGKAAIVAQAYEPRFALGYIASSGAGGVNLYRRNYGEGIPNLAATNEYHWFAGNFLKYGAAGKTANDLPVDSHQFLALVAPRPTYIGGGATILTPPELVPGDAWVDARGMFMAAVAASPAWKLHGKQGLETDRFPAMLTYLGKGDIGFRQHQYGHTPQPNWPTFIEFASKYFK
jgi:hypothetical protein